MSTRYLTNLALALLGGFLVVTSQAFAAGTFGWLMLGVGIAALVICVPAIAIRSRGIGQRGIDSLVSLLGAWTIVASQVFAGSTVTWLGFASGAALVGLGVAGLSVHELSTERVVHSFELRSSSPNGAAVQSESERERAGVR
jgi:hypothetical protein